MFIRKQKYLPFFMWLFPLLFFSYQFILRLWPGLMMQQIMQQFTIEASAFGMLAALYYYGYSGMQIPVAILLDRFSPRYVVFGCAVLCGIATLLFSYSDNWYLACVSRFLIGVGSAVGFLGTSKVISQWFPKEQYAKMVGLSFTIGLLGAIYGGKPISLLIAHYSWQKVALALGCVSIALGLGSWLLLRAPKLTHTGPDGETFKISYFKKLLSSPVIWLLALGNFLMVGSLEGFADVWGVSYLMTAYGITKDKAAELVSFVFVGMLLGGPLLAFLSKRLGNYTVMSICGLGMALAFLVLLRSNAPYHWYGLASLFFCVGILCCYQVIVFAAGAQLVKEKLLGVTVAFLNCVNMLGGSFFHTTIGFIMDAFWTSTIGHDGVRHYSIESYGAALMIIPFCAFLGACILGYVGLKLSQRKLLMVQNL